MGNNTGKKNRLRTYRDNNTGKRGIIRAKGLGSGPIHTERCRDKFCDGVLYEGPCVRMGAVDARGGGGVGGKCWREILLSVCRIFLIFIF